MQEGQKVRDYVLEEKIGEGGMGEVWRARHAILDRHVAIKGMARHLETDPEFGRRFLQEAQSQARLNHPNIVGVSDFFAEDEQYFLVMPLMSGKSLADLLHEIQGPMPISDALVIARDVLDALDYAHRNGVIHRDVKPSNILLDRDGHAALTDFGIALSLGRRRVTLTRTSLGTPHYMSPEQIRSPKTVDHRTDVYSFGCVLYEMLAGRPPFADAADGDDTDFALKEAHVYRAPESLRTRNSNVPAWLDAVVLRALAKNPDERFFGCGEFRRALDAPQSAIPLSSPAPEPGQAVRKPGPMPAHAYAHGKRLPVTVMALALVVLAALVAFAMRDRWQPKGPAADELTTELTSTEPLGTDLGPIEVTEVKSKPPKRNAESSTEPLATDTAAREPTEEPTPATDDLEKEVGPAKPKDRETESVKIEIKKSKDKDAETDESQSTGLEVKGGITPPLDTDLVTADPLGTDLRPPV